MSMKIANYLPYIKSLFEKENNKKLVSTHCNDPYVHINEFTLKYETLILDFLNQEPELFLTFLSEFTKRFPENSVVYLNIFPEETENLLVGMFIAVENKVYSISEAELLLFKRSVSNTQKLSLTDIVRTSSLIRKLTNSKNIKLLIKNELIINENDINIENYSLITPFPYITTWQNNLLDFALEISSMINENKTNCDYIIMLHGSFLSFITNIAILASVSKNTIKEKDDFYDRLVTRLGKYNKNLINLKSETQYMPAMRVYMPAMRVYYPIKNKHYISNIPTNITFKETFEDYALSFMEQLDSFPKDCNIYLTIVKSNEPKGYIPKSIHFAMFGLTDLNEKIFANQENIKIPENGNTIEFFKENKEKTDRNILAETCELAKNLGLSLQDLKNLLEKSWNSI